MSMTIQFDTLRYVEKLKSAGVPAAQAMAEAEALATALGESASGLLATKDDVTAIRFALPEIKFEQQLVKWMLLLLNAGVIALILRAYS